MQGWSIRITVVILPDVSDKTTSVISVFPEATIWNLVNLNCTS